jgi:hypothetical protein
VADRAGTKHQFWRIVGALNALTGQVEYLADYIVGRRQGSACYPVRPVSRRSN